MKLSEEYDYYEKKFGRRTPCPDKYKRQQVSIWRKIERKTIKEAEAIIKEAKAKNRELNIRNNPFLAKSSDSTEQKISFSNNSVIEESESKKPWSNWNRDWE